MQTLAVKYRPQEFDDVVEQNVIKAILQNQLNSGDIKNCYLFCGPAGTGKAQPMYSKILTPNGFITMGDVKVGTKVYTRLGKETTVTSIYPQGLRKVYQINFNDGTNIRVSDSHLNSVYIYNKETNTKENECVLVTTQLIEMFNKGYVLMVDTPIIEFTGNADVVSINIEDVYLNGIPKEYLLARYSIRLMILMELTASTVQPVAGVQTFVTDSDKLSNDFEFLVRSLGYVDTILNDNGIYTHTIEFLGNENKGRQIVSIEYVGEEECQCIYVEDEDHTYITDNFTPTHNTTNARLFVKAINDGDTSNLTELDAASHNGVDDMRKLIDDSKYKPIGCKYRTYLIDECFHSSTIVKCPNGDKKISEINEGDYVYSMVGASSVKRVFKNRVPVEDLIIVTINGIDTLTTKEHLYMTKNGWKPVSIIADDVNIVTYNYMYNEWQWHDGNKSNNPFDILKYAVKDTRMELEYDTEIAVVRNCDWNGYSTVISNTESYEPGVNDDKFIKYFTKEELEYGVVTMYDLEVTEHHSYFANGILVHNCHSLSNTAWQAMLKTIEEPTPTSIFVLCTTDPQKIPSTILSRVQRYDFQRITHSGIVNRLKHIIEKENEEGCNYTYEEDALSYIAKLADGGMRDSITMLEKVLGYSSNVTMESVTKALGTVDYNTMFDLTDALCKMDKKTVIEIIETIHRNGLDLKQFIKNYNYFVLDLCKYDVCRSFDYLQIPNTYKSRMSTYKNEDFAFFTSLLNEVIKLNSDIKWDSAPKPSIESTFILLCSEA